MKCPNCGNDVQDDAIFCDQCGTRIHQQEAAVSTAPAAEPASAASASVPAPASPAAGTDVAAAAGAAQGSVCSNCGASNTPGEMFCSECGTPLEAPKPEPVGAAEVAELAPVQAPAGGPRVCPACGATIVEDDTFCYACGAELAAAPVAAPAETVETVVPVEPATPAEPAPAVQPAPAPAAPATEAECPACGAKVTPDDTFCEFCGAALVAPQETVAPAAPAAPAPTPATPAPAARLVVANSGVEIPLASGDETVVGREDPYSGVFPDIDLTPHGGEEGGVSRRHFRIKLAGGQYTIEDLNSTNFTMLNRQRLQPGVPMTIADGDEIRAGRVKLIFKAN